MTFNEFRQLSPKRRVKYANENPKWLETLNQSQLDEVGRLLCHASLPQMRETSPIERDYYKRDSDKFNQDEFERSIFGTIDGNTTIVDAATSIRGPMPLE